jgi:GT2 family glycosyltransferase
MDQTSISPFSPQPELKVSVIVPVYNGGDNFHLCLSALAHATPPPEEIIVVADGYTDGSWLIAEEFGAKILKIPVSGGPAKARNLGAETAKGGILFFVDADVVVPPDIIGKVETAFHNEPGMTALIGSYDDEPGETNFLSQYKNLFHHYIHQTSREEATTFWGACGAIRRDIFLKIGGFDKGYRESSIEDIELGYRLRQTGYDIRLAKEIQVKHLKHWGIVSLLKSDFFDRALPWTELILRNGAFINDLNLRLSNRISTILVYGILITIASAVCWSKALALTIAFALMLIAINLPVYRFFLRKRGLWFMVKVIPWHWLYYLYCGLAFAAGIGRHLLIRQKGPRPDL